jgi:hypothetical protein
MALVARDEAASFARLHVAPFLVQVFTIVFFDPSYATRSIMVPSVDRMPAQLHRPSTF